MITSVNHITLAIKDIEKSFRFYRDILGFTPLVKWDRGAYFLVGQDNFWFCLNVDESHQESPSYTHYAFSVVPAQFDTMTSKIRNSGACIFKENTSPGESLYFLDPDGHKLEIHASTWKDRITFKKQNLGSWKNVEWFI